VFQAQAAAAAVAHSPSFPKPLLITADHFWPAACRAGRPGTVVSLVSGGERFVVDKLGRRLGVAIREVEVSHGEAKGVEGRRPGAGSPAGAAGGAQSKPKLKSRSGSRSGSSSD
jgi:hypothetical protein